MKHGFELLKTRDLSNPLDVGILEKKYHISVPPLLRLFCETFVINGEEDIDIYNEMYLPPSTELNKLRNCTMYEYMPNEEVMFSHFVSLEFALSNMGNDDAWVENQHIPIGVSGFNGGIVIGTKLHEQDYVILEDPDGLVQYTKIADNIFEFVRGLTQIPSDEDELEIFDTTFAQLYRNWGEDFWRVRPSQK